jgi:hypothetical protein
MFLGNLRHFLCSARAIAKGAGLLLERIALQTKNRSALWLLATPGVFVTSGWCERSIRSRPAPCSRCRTPAFHISKVERASTQGKYPPWQRSHDAVKQCPAHSDGYQVWPLGPFGKGPVAAGLTLLS